MSQCSGSTIECHCFQMNIHCVEPRLNVCGRCGCVSFSCEIRPCCSSPRWVNELGSLAYSKTTHLIACMGKSRRKLQFTLSHADARARQISASSFANRDNTVTLNSTRVSYCKFNAKIPIGFAVPKCTCHPWARHRWNSQHNNYDKINNN